MSYSHFFKLSVMVLMFSSVSAIAAAKDKIAYALSDGAVSPNGSIHLMEFDGSNSKNIFDFSNHPKDQDAPIYELHANSGKIYFTSDNSMFYGPARFNIFETNGQSTQPNQLTPGENAGKWGLTGLGTVTGTVKRGTGIPYGSAPVYLEGKGMLNADVNGEFTFSNVAPGYYWLNAFRTGETVFQSQYVYVQNNLTTTFHFVPNTGDRYSHSAPARFQDRVYYIHSFYTNTDIKYTNTQGVTPHTEVVNYNNLSTQCAGNSSGELDAFSVGQKTGKLVIYKYANGPACGGIYTADKDGNNLSQLVDMTTAFWNGVYEPIVSNHQVFWNSEESLFAFNYYTTSNEEGFAIVNAQGTVTDYLTFQPDYKVTLYGWSSDNAWLLFSAYSGSNSSTKWLYKVPVNSSGIFPVDGQGNFDNSKLVALLQDKNITGASWVTSNNNVMPGIRYLLLD